MSDLGFYFETSDLGVGLRIRWFDVKINTEVRYGGEMCVFYCFFFFSGVTWVMGLMIRVWFSGVTWKYMGWMIRWVAIHRFFQWLGCKFDDDLMACFGFDMFLSWNLLWGDLTWVGLMMIGFDGFVWGFSWNMSDWTNPQVDAFNSGLAKSRAEEETQLCVRCVVLFTPLKSHIDTQNGHMNKGSHLFQPMIFVYTVYILDILVFGGVMFLLVVWMVSLLRCNLFKETSWFCFFVLWSICLFFLLTFFSLFVVACCCKLLCIGICI